MITFMGNTNKFEYFIKIVKEIKKQLLIIKKQKSTSSIFVIKLVSLNKYYVNLQVNMVYFLQSIILKQKSNNLLSFTIFINKGKNLLF